MIDTHSQLIQENLLPIWTIYDPFGQFITYLDNFCPMLKLICIESSLKLTPSLYTCVT